MITIYKSVYETEKPNYISLDKALERIKSGQQLERINEIRNGDRDQKIKLPIVLFSGKFASRKDEDLRQHSGFIVLDFDHINVPESKKVLATDKYVHACWVSPSGDGLKALVRVTNPDKHREHFRALCEYFDSQYGLEVDPSGINESRACFESYDPELVQNGSSEKFGGMAFEKTAEQVASIGTDTDYSKLYLAACMIRKAQDGEKHTALLKASILMGGYIAAGRVEEEEALRVLEREISRKDIDSLDRAMKTVYDGIEQGKSAPIGETVQAEDAARRELLLNDGDMSFMSSDKDDLEWILSFKRGEFELGLTTGNTLLDRNFRYKREYTMISGHSSIGKTTFMIYLMVGAAINHDWRWIIYSAENNTASIKMRIIQFATGKALGEMTIHEISAYMRWVSDHFVVINNERTLSYSDVLVFAEKICRSRQIDGLLIDPYNALRIALSANRGVGVHEYHYEAASEFLAFCQRMNIAVWVNAHSVTSSQRQKGDDGLPVAPFAEDTEHGGKWVNRSDNFITLHRKIHHPEPDRRREVELHVRKIRNQETGGEPTPLDSPFIFRMTEDKSTFEMLGPWPNLFQHINIDFVEKQMEIEG